MIPVSGIMWTPPEAYTLQTFTLQTGCQDQSFSGRLHPTPSIPTELLVGEPEVKVVQVLATDVKYVNDILKRFSSWTTLVKVVARD